MPDTGSEPAGHPRRLRWRLALLFCLASVLSGLVLLVIVILVARQLLPGDVRVTSPAPRFAVRFEDNDELRNRALEILLLAVAIMTPTSLAAGWAVAGRILRPVRTMTDKLRQISDHNVHERLALPGRHDELTGLARTIDDLLGRLESALEAHRRFVANAAHELRTPLTVEHALLEESLIDKEPTVAAYRANFERLLDVSRARSRLLESLLTLAGSEHARDHTERTDLAPLARAVLDDLHAPGLRVQAHLAPAPVLGDPTLLTRLIANLCDNAAHYNEPGGRIDVTTRRSGRRSVLTVENTGPVVPADQVDRLVSPFQRLRRVADDGHHGLGLSIVRAVARAHRATLGVRARPRGGLAVEVTFSAAG